MGLPSVGSGPLENPHRQAGLRPARRLSGHALFFPAAAAFGIAALPLSVLPMAGIAPLLPGLASPAGHAHEMLFGFALAVVAGNQLGPVPARRLVALLVVWIAARAAFLLAPGSIAELATNVAFPALLTAQLSPRLFFRAKKLRNRALPVVLVALFASALAFQLAALLDAARLEPGILASAVQLLALLMLFMGGRIIAPAVAGQHYRQGMNLGPRVQARIEGALIIVMLAAIALSAWPAFPPARALGAGALIAAGVLAMVRLLRWRLWKLRGRPDLLCLGAGYAWLVLGLLGYGAALATGRHAFAALHLITVGALGTLTLNVMALTWLRLARRDPAAAREPPWGTLLIAAAAIGRVAADFTLGHRPALLLLAAACWSAAFLLLLALFARVKWGSDSN